MISPGKHIVILGDVMVDRWIHGTIDRISPEAPVPIFLEDYCEETPGGAGNVAENVKALGCIPHLVSSSNRPLKIRHVVNGQQVGFRHDVENNTPIDAQTEAEMMNQVEKVHVDAVIISDYAKGVVTPTLCRSVIGWAKRQRIPVIVDPKGKDWDKYRGATVICPNEAEMAHGPDGSEVLCDAILITMGAKGMLLCTDNRIPEGKPLHIPAMSSEVVDVVGAGDTVVATLACCLASGMDLETSARWANAAAGVVVRKRGTATCSTEELTLALNRPSWVRPWELVA